MTFEDVCQELGLQNTPDWGIINSNSERVDEFIEFISNHSNLSNNIEYEFIELIIASMNSALIEEKYNWQLIIKFCKYMKPILFNDKYFPFVEYWIGIKSESEYPVGILLESLKEIYS